MRFTPKFPLAVAFFGFMVSTTLGCPSSPTPATVTGDVRAGAVALIEAMIRDDPEFRRVDVGNHNFSEKARGWELEAHLLGGLVLGLNTMIVDASFLKRNGTRFQVELKADRIEYYALLEAIMLDEDKTLIFGEGGKRPNNKVNFVATGTLEVVFAFLIERPSGKIKDVRMPVMKLKFVSAQSSLEDPGNQPTAILGMAVFKEGMKKYFHDDLLRSELHRLMEKKLSSVTLRL